MTTAERMPRADPAADRRSDDLLVAGVDAVEAADRDRARDRLDVEQALADDHPSTTTGSQAAVTRLADAQELFPGHEPHRARLAARLEAAAVADAFGLDGREIADGKVRKGG